MKFHASYNPHDSSEPLGDPRVVSQEFIVHIPRRSRRERVLMPRWATPASHMNILRVRRGVVTSLSKITSALLILATFYVGLSGTGGTLSYLSDQEVSIGNLLVADPLGFTLSLLWPSQVDISGGSAYVVPVLTPNADSEPIQYSLTGHMSSGDSALCSLLNVLATSSVLYEGPLDGFTTGMSTSTGEVPLFFSVPEGMTIPENTSCFVDLAFKGRNADAPLGQGYSDEKIITVQFYVPASAPLLRQESQSALVAPLPEESTPLDKGTSSLDVGSTTPPLSEATTTDPIVPNEPQSVGQGSTVGSDQTPPPTEPAPPETPTEPVPPTPDPVPDAPPPPPPVEEPTPPAPEAPVPPAE